MDYFLLLKQEKNEHGQIPGDVLSVVLLYARAGVLGSTLVS